MPLAALSNWKEHVLQILWDHCSHKIHAKYNNKYVHKRHTAAEKIYRSCKVGLFGTVHVTGLPISDNYWRWSTLFAQQNSLRVLKRGLISSQYQSDKKRILKNATFEDLIVKSVFYVYFQLL